MAVAGAEGEVVGREEEEAAEGVTWSEMLQVPVGLIVGMGGVGVREVCAEAEAQAVVESVRLGARVGEEVALALGV